jgi:hypothetical protein
MNSNIEALGPLPNEENKLSFLNELFHVSLPLYVLTFRGTLFDSSRGVSLDIKTFVIQELQLTKVLLILLKQDKFLGNI